MTATLEAPVKRNPHIERFSDRTIVSIYPIRCEKEMNSFRGFKRYILEAAPRGGWTTLEVGTSGQWVKDMSTVDQDNPTPGMRAVETPAFDEASELVRHWTSNTAGRGRPGIGLLPYGVNPPAPGEQASPEFARFLAELNAVQTEYAQWYVKDANDKKVKGEMKNIMDSTHRAMGRWLYGSGAEKFEWYGKTVYMETKQCFACSREIMAAALVCEHCSTNFIDWHLKYGTEPENDPAVAAALANVRKRNFAVDQPIADPINYGIELPKVELPTEPVAVEDELDGDLIPVSMAAKLQAQEEDEDKKKIG